ncbi:uncharacterized protein LTR77_011022 [Saxophila tyrrhenica]|uniref:F-box domain-containing protein n=1 Tax=Saxophila tyrrhenica TaxID=1690608 RepID=A0AAV9NWB1_9PEZI|nr:hypothetical protein LTR77_011022 [Saxophila tyrrhenica]
MFEAVEIDNSLSLPPSTSRTAILLTEAMAPRKRKKQQRELRAQNLTELSKKHDLNPLLPADGKTARLPSYYLAASQPQLEDLVRSSKQATLGDRFHSLPTELRLHIFSFLACQPVKWKMTHQEGCNKTPPMVNDMPGDGSPNAKAFFDTCIRCMSAHWHTVLPLSRRDNPARKAWRNPWRSRWAPEVANEFMGSDCWDENFRPRPCPQSITTAIEKGQLPCLCARRQNLEVMLVCRQWREEAGRLFYSSNTFAFEDAVTFVDFVDNLPDHWRSLVTKVSILKHRPVESSDMAPSTTKIQWMLFSFESPRQLSPLWSALRRLPSLSHLELDALFLTRAPIVKSLLRLGLQNLRSVRFVLRELSKWISEPPETSDPQYIWPRYASSRYLTGGLAEQVAAAIKGQRKAWLKVTGNVERAVEREREVLTAFFEQEANRMLRFNGRVKRTAAVFDEALHYDESVEEWARLWDQCGSAARPVYAYLPMPVRPAIPTESPEGDERSDEEVPCAADLPYPESEMSDEEMAIDIFD